MMEARFDRILQEASTTKSNLISCPNRVERQRCRLGHNLILRFQENREGTLMYLHNPLVEGRENLVKRDIRSLRLKQKIQPVFDT